jgi:hypothetical protein
MDRVSGGFAFEDTGEKYAVRPNQENEQLKSVNEKGVESILTARKTGAGLRWDIKCGNGVELTNVKNWPIKQGCYIVDQFGNEIGSDLIPR